MQKHIDIYLVNMPMSAVQRPSIALGTLSALLKKAGLRVKTLYANMWFSEYFGMETHKAIALTLPQHLVCEWLFSNSAFPNHHVDDDAFFEGIEDDYCGIDTQARIPDWPAFRKIALETKAAIPVYLDWVASHILSVEPAIVGCSSIFQQNVASLALLRKIKDTNPDVVTMMGGSNCETIMGKTMHEHFTWLDYVASGEVDTFIAKFCRQILIQGRDILADEMPEGMFGPIHRSDGYPNSCNSYDALPRAMTSSLHKLPPPDYDDFFAELKGNYLSKLIVPALPFEGARGCWWGAKSHCTFCGLNGVGMNFREKSADQLEAELDYLSERYEINNFSAVDNILSLNHMKHFLPRLEKSSRTHQLFYETKANLKKHQIEQLYQAHIRWIQPGIESLNSDVLSLMKKGVSAWQNIQTLKYARQFGVYLSWTVLAGFPGEKDEWYESMSSLPSLLSHLQPGGFTMLRYDRYSIYHRDSADYDLDLVPFASYAQVYPLSQEALHDLAYFFYDKNTPYSNARQAIEYNSKKRPWLHSALDNWRKWNRSWSTKINLIARQEGNELVITDTRPIARGQRVTLDKVQAEILLYCDKAPSLKALHKTFAHLAELLIEETIDHLKDYHFLLEIDGRLLSLVLQEPLNPYTNFQPFGKVLG